MLAVVEHDESLLGRQSCYQDVERRLTRARHHPESIEDRGGDRVLAGDRRKIDEPHAIARAVEELGS